MRINDRIRVSPVRLIGPDGNQIGIVPTSEALERAEEAGLDLVEIAPTSKPPVCRIMDYGKFKYELSKKDRLAKKKQHVYQLKEMRYRPKIDEHDYNFKTRHVREFLQSGSKVKAYVFFRGREMAHIELGRRVLDRLVADMEDIAIIDMQPKLEGRKMNMVLSPRPEIIKQAYDAKAQKEKEKEQQRSERLEKPGKAEEPDVAEKTEETEIAEKE